MITSLRHFSKIVLVSGPSSLSDFITWFILGKLICHQLSPFYHPPYFKNTQKQTFLKFPIFVDFSNKILWGLKYECNTFQMFEIKLKRCSLMAPTRMHHSSILIPIWVHHNFTIETSIDCCTHISFSIEKCSRFSLISNNWKSVALIFETFKLHNLDILYVSKLKSVTV